MRLSLRRCPRRGMTASSTVPAESAVLLVVVAPVSSTVPGAETVTGSFAVPFLVFRIGRPIVNEAGAAADSVLVSVGRFGAGTPVPESSTLPAGRRLLSTSSVVLARAGGKGSEGDGELAARVRCDLRVRAGGRRSEGELGAIRTGHGDAADEERRFARVFKFELIEAPRARADDRGAEVVGDRGEDRFRTRYRKEVRLHYVDRPVEAPPYGDRGAVGRDPDLRGASGAPGLREIVDALLRGSVGGERPLLHDEGTAVEPAPDHGRRSARRHGDLGLGGVPPGLRERPVAPGGPAAGRGRAWTTKELPS